MSEATHDFIIGKANSAIIQENLPTLLSLYTRIFPDAKIANKTPEEAFAYCNGMYGGEALWVLGREGKQFVAMGTAGYNQDLDLVHVYNVGVDPVFRRRGWATKVLEKISALFPDCNEYGTVKKGNQVAKQFYEQQGKVKIGETEEYDLYR